MGSREYKRKYEWNEEKKRFLIENRHLYSANELARMLGITQELVYWYVKKYNIKRQKNLWTSDEISTLNEMLDKKPKEILMYFPRHTLKSLKMQMERLRFIKEEAENGNYG